MSCLSCGSFFDEKELIRNSPIISPDLDSKDAISLQGESHAENVKISQAIQADFTV